MCRPKKKSPKLNQLFPSCYLLIRVLSGHCFCVPVRDSFSHDEIHYLAERTIRIQKPTETTSRRSSTPNPNTQDQLLLPIISTLRKQQGSHLLAKESNETVTVASSCQTLISVSALSSILIGVSPQILSICFWSQKQKTLKF